MPKCPSHNVSAFRSTSFYREVIATLGSPPGNLIRFMYVLTKEHSLAGNVHGDDNAAMSVTRNVESRKLVLTKAQVVFSLF